MRGGQQIPTQGHSLKRVLTPCKTPTPAQETAELEHETFRLKQQAAIAAEIKSVLDSHVRYEAQLREQEQRDLVQTVLSNVQKQLTDKKLQRDILLSSVAEVEELIKSKAI